MEPTLNYKRIYFEESFGRNNYGIQILVSVPRELNERDKAKSYRWADEIRKWLTAETERLDPVRQEDRVATKNQLLDCFGNKEIYVEEIPNEYCEDDMDPWFIVTTTQGHFKIGWRKRVIVLNWSKTKIHQTSEILFPNEDTTKDGQMIHCWGYEKLTEYIDFLHNLPTLMSGMLDSQKT